GVEPADEYEKAVGIVWADGTFSSCDEWIEGPLCEILAYPTTAANSRSTTSLCVCGKRAFGSIPRRPAYARSLSTLLLAIFPFNNSLTRGCGSAKIASNSLGEYFRA